MAQAHPNLTVTGSRVSSPTDPGRHLTSQAAFSPGDLITSFTNPALCLPSTPHLLQVCSSCLSLPHPDSDPANRDPSSPKLLTHPSSTTHDPGPQLINSKPVKACTGCKSISYCSTACQRADWRRVHRHECKIFSRIAKEQPGKTLPTPVRGALQVMLRWGEMKPVFAELEGHESQFRGEAGGKMWHEMGLQAMAVVEYAGLIGKEGKDSSFWGEVVRGVLCKLQTNSFHRLDADFGQDGTFLDVTLAMVNHSCVPNAFVYFFGRNAYLKATRPIQKGDEITISYIAPTNPLVQRHLDLALYHFTCTCRRCSSDLDNYEVCKSDPAAELNTFSLQPDLDRYRSPPTTTSKGLTKSQVSDIYRAFHLSKPADESPTPLPYLRVHWKKCRPLVQKQLYALQPLPMIVTDTLTHCTMATRYAHALCLACFQAINIDPFMYPAPFRQERLRTCLSIAKLLVNIVFEESAKPGAWFDASVPFHPQLRDTFRTEIDPILLAQAMLIMVVHYGPQSHDENWNVQVEAKGMLRQFEGRQDREGLTAGLLEWEREPGGETGRQIYEFVVGKPLGLLAGFAIDVLKHELES